MSTTILVAMIPLSLVIYRIIRYKKLFQQCRCYIIDKDNVQHSYSRNDRWESTLPSYTIYNRFDLICRFGRNSNQPSTKINVLYGISDRYIGWRYVGYSNVFEITAVYDNPAINCHEVYKLGYVKLGQTFNCKIDIKSNTTVFGLITTNYHTLERKSTFKVYPTKQSTIFKQILTPTHNGVREEQMKIFIEVRY